MDSRSLPAPPPFEYLRTKTFAEGGTVTLAEVILRAAGDPTFVREWARLTGNRLPGNPVEQLIDGATGHDGELARRFAAFVYETVWCRLQVAEEP